MARKSCFLEATLMFSLALVIAFTACLFLVNQQARFSQTNPGTDLDTFTSFALTDSLGGKISGLSFSTLDYSVTATKPIAGFIKLANNATAAQNASVVVYVNNSFSIGNPCYTLPTVYSGSDGSFATNLGNLKRKDTGGDCSGFWATGDPIWAVANGSTVVPYPQGNGMSAPTTIASGTGLQYLPNFTIAQGPDLIAPRLVLDSPGNNTNETINNTITFRYNASDNINLDTCLFFLNGLLNQTDTNPVNNATNNFTVTLSNGFYNWSVNCSDNNSNSNLSEIWFLNVDVPDTTPPTLSDITSGLPFPIYNNGSEQNLTVNFTSDDYPINVTFNLYNSTGDIIDTITFPVNSSGDLPINYTIPGGLPEGNYTLNLTATDTAGNNATYTLGDIIVDATAPIISNITTGIPFPLYNNGSEQNLTVNFTSDEYPINVTFNLYNETGDLIDTLTFPVNSSGDLPVTYTIPGGLADGNYSLNMTVTDPAGNSNTTVLGDIIVDTAPPVISDITTDIPFPIYNNGTSQNLTVNFTSSEYPINVTFNLYNETGSIVNTVTYPINSSTDLPITYTLPGGLPDGNYSLNMTITDQTGNDNTYVLGDIVVDTTAPIISNLVSTPPFPIHNNGSEQTVTLNFTSNEYPINLTLNIYNATGDLINYSVIQLSNSNDLPVNFTIPGGLAEGNYAFNLTATDTAGNDATYVLGDMIVDTTAPVVSNITTDIPFPVANNGSAQDITINFTSSEYPINVTFNLYNETGSIIDTITFPVNSSGDLPINYTIPGGLPDGNYSLNMTITDQTGNDNTYVLGDIIVDTAPPVLSDITTDVTFPLYNNGTAQNITVNFTSSEYPINVTFNFYNSTGDIVNTVTYPLSSSGDLPLTYIVPGGLSDGNYSLNMTVTDQVGNDNTYVLGDIIVDTTAPIISNITSNIPFPLYNNGTTQNLTINFTSNEYPINITFNLYNSTGSIVDTITYPVNSSANLPVTYTIPGGLPEGNYTLNMTVTDAASNSNTTILGDIIVDTTPPTISNFTSDLPFPITNNGTAQNVSVNFTSNEYPINITFNLYNSTGNIVNTVTYPVNSSVDLPLIYTIPDWLADGNYSLNLTATDQIGNDNTYVLGDIIVATFANTPPTVSSQTYLNYPDHQFSVSVNASDLDPQILNCTLYHSKTFSYTPKPMMLVAGNTSNGTWAINLSTVDGYNVSDSVNTYVSCNDTIDITNSTLDNHPLPNYAPAAPVIDLTPDTPSDNLDLYCTITANSTDADNDSVSYYFLWYKNTVLNLTIGPLNQDINSLGAGNTTFGDEWNCTVIPFDSYANGTAASDKVTIVLNNPPAFNQSKTLPNATWTEDTNYTNYALKDYFYDLDFDNLTYDYTAVSNIAIIINQTTGNVTFTPDQNFNGLRTVKFNATDSLAWSNYSNLITLNITPVDDAPQFISNISNKTWVRNTNLTINLSPYFQEVDGETLIFTSTQPNNITVHINGSLVILEPAADWFGTRSIIFTANDSISTVDSNNITLNILASTPYPNVSKFDDHTNFTEWFENYYNLQAVENMYLEIMAYGKIQWHNPVNAEYENYDAYVDISKDYVAVDSTNLHASINSSATVWFYNLSFDVPFPTIMIKESGVWRTCPPSICTLIGYGNGTAVFNVTHFTGFALSSEPPVPYLRIPEHQSTVIVLNPTFDWSDVSDPNPEDLVTHYILQYATDSAFTTNVVNVTVNANASSYSIPWVNRLSDNTQYYWRVQAYNDKGLGSGWQTTPFWFLVNTTAHNCTSDMLAHEVEGTVYHSDNVTPLAQNTLVRLEVIDGPNVGHRFYTTVDSDMVPNLEWGNGYYLVMDNPCFRTGDNFTMYAENGTHEGWNYNNTFQDGTTGAWGTGYVDIILNQTIPYPYKPTNVMAYAVGNGSTIYINWSPALYADAYNIHVSDNLTFVPNPIGTTPFTYFFDTTSSNYSRRYYLIEAIRVSYGNESDEIVGKFNILIKDGLNLVSLPLLVDDWNLRFWNGSAFHNVTYPIVNNTAYTDYNITKFFRRANNSFDPSLLWVDSPTYGEYWASAEPTFYSVDNDRGYYAEVEAIDNNTWYNWTIAGKVALGTRNITLAPGLNMVGFTRLTDGLLRINNGTNVTIDPSNLFINNSAYPNYDITGIWWYNTSQFQFLDYINALDSYYSSNAPNFTTIEPGKGYFIETITADNTSHQFNFTTI